MHDRVIKMVARDAKQQATQHVGTLLFWVVLGFLGSNLALTSLARAGELSRNMIKQLVVQHSHETRHVDATLALGIARVMSNFDAGAVGPAQRLGPWPMSRVVSYPGGIVANIFAARAVFEREFAVIHQPTVPAIDTMLYATGSPGDIYTRYDPVSDLPRWRKKIATTRYWLSEADRLRRASAL